MQIILTIYTPETLPKLSQLASFNEISTLLEDATCELTWKGRKVSVPDYVGSYELWDISNRVLEIWRAQEMTPQARRDLTLLADKISNWYTEMEIIAGSPNTNIFTYLLDIRRYDVEAELSYNPNGALSTPNEWLFRENGKQKLCNTYSRNEWETTFSTTSWDSLENIGFNLEVPQGSIPRKTVSSSVNVLRETHS